MDLAHENGPLSRKLVNDIKDLVLSVRVRARISSVCVRDSVGPKIGIHDDDLVHTRARHDMPCPGQAA